MITYSQIRDYSIRELADLHPNDLCRLKNEAESMLEIAKASKELIDLAVHLKYQHLVSSLREANNKETGVIKFMDRDVPISVDVAKRVSWNQEALAEIIQRITDSGEDPEEFVEITYKVPERKYTAWPKELRNSFSHARTLKTGKPVYKLGESQE